MDALPVTLGSEFASYTTTLTIARDGITSAKKELEKVALGGTAVGTGANTPRGYRNIAITELAKKSKLPLRPQQDMQYALQSRYAVANMSSALKNYSVELGKIANDIRLMASGPIAGFGELEIPAVHAGSSIMPGKVNPSLAECMNMICFSVIGNDTTVTLAAQAGQFELNVMLPVMLKAVLDSTDMLTSFLPIFTENLIDGLAANKEKLQANIEKSPVIVTLLAPKIGYQKSADLFKESIKTGKTIRNLVISKKLMTKKQVDSLLKVSMAKICVEAYGCSASFADSEMISGLIVNGGHTLVQDPSDADLNLIVTCSVKDVTADKDDSSHKTITVKATCCCGLPAKGRKTHCGKVCTKCKHDGTKFYWKNTSSDRNHAKWIKGCSA